MSAPSNNPPVSQQSADRSARYDLEAKAHAARTNFRTTAVKLDAPGDASVFDEQTRADAAEIIARYPQGQSRSALLPILHLVQSVQGYVTPDGIAFCAEVLELSKAQVLAVASYYTMFKRTRTGEYLVSVCTNTLCGLLGGDDIYAALRTQLGLGAVHGALGSDGAPPSGLVSVEGDTSSDGTITLEHAECLAACDYAPVVTVNYEFFDNQTVGSARNLVDELRSGQRPMPTRGAPLCSFKQTERQIAGFFDADTFAVDAVSTGGPTEVGVQLSLARGEGAPSYAAGDGNEEADRSAQRISQQPTSAHDAPLSTSDSDQANDPGPQTDKRSGTASIPTGDDATPKSKSKAPRRTRNSTTDAPKKED
jgi:NADH-quinone oxidoreductase subunit E